MLVVGEDNNVIYGDSDTGTGSGQDTIVVGQGTDEIQGPGQAQDIVIQDDGSPLDYSYQINGKTASYKEDPDTGEVMVYDHVFGRWDVVGERYWDGEVAAWITNMGHDIVVEYANKTLRYDNYSTDISIQDWNGTWEPYDPDEHYIVDFRQDPETGKLLIYNNDLGTYDPYMEEHRPEGANYMILNEGAAIHIIYDDGAEVWLENYGEGAWLKAPETGERWVTLPGNQVYHDASTGIWYCYGWESWHYSIDTCQTWVDVPMLEFRVVGETGTVDMFDGRFWTHDHGAQLQFFDNRYAQSGWHNMSEFVVEYYDGVGYDGEPLKVVDVAITDEESESAVWLNHLVQTGGNSETPSPDVTITEWDTHVYGQWDSKLISSWIIPNPSAEYNSWATAARAGSGTGVKPLNVFFQAENTDTYNLSWLFEDAMGTDVLYRRYNHDGYSLESMIRDLNLMCDLRSYLYIETSANYEPVKIQNLMILNHGDDVGVFRVGTDTIKPDNFYERGYDKAFVQLGQIMSDQAQIQHYGCLQAGANPYDPIIVAHQGDGTAYDAYTAGSLANRAWMGRRMMSTIAQLTGATVFTSSDVNGMLPVNKCSEYDFPHFEQETEMCLEFGVASSGNQVDFWRAFHTESASGSPLWNMQKFPHFSTSLQSDSDYNRQGPPSALKFYFPDVQTYGEEVPKGQLGTVYLPLDWWRTGWLVRRT